MESDISVNILSTSFEIKSVAIHPSPEDDAPTSLFDRQRGIETTKAKESNQGNQSGCLGRVGATRHRLTKNSQWIVEKNNGRPLEKLILFFSWLVERQLVSECLGWVRLFFCLLKVNPLDMFNHLFRDLKRYIGDKQLARESGDCAPFSNQF
ncbi:hypothetical protein CDAR_65081 [Caerostris darwini]|uniref:Uncharacterized protein n=1 Tax=Caerostris darwini TaxID=1538125 RepID=A0AAV4VS36_9ARAC|nr:hypothetical protein CDAR_65081 [Caerostris darwini]